MSLYVKGLLFDYATIFASNHESISEAQYFEITDEMYGDFKDYIAGQEFEYSTQSSDKLKDLIKTAKFEGYYDKIEEQLDALENQLHGDKEKDLETFSTEIKELLKDEIVSRYYYQKGRIQSGLASDPEIAKAIDLLNDQTTMMSILNGSYNGETVFAYYTH